MENLVEHNTNSKDRFKFNIPLEILKADEKGWKVRGIASTEDQDLQGEIVRQNGLDITPLKEGRGLFNYEHKNDPENIIGMIENADIGNEGLSVEGYLFKKHKRAQAIAEIMQSLNKDHQKRVQLSIEGKIKERGEDQKEIRQAMVDRVAITFEPVNQKTYIQFAKSLKESENIEEIITLTSGSDPKDLLVTEELNQELEKMLVADGNAGTLPPAQRTGGAALQPEEVDSDLKNLKNPSKKKTKNKIPKIIKKKILGKALIRAFNEFPSIPRRALIASVLKVFCQKIAD